MRVDGHGHLLVNTLEVSSLNTTDGDAKSIRISGQLATTLEGLGGNIEIVGGNGGRSGGDLFLSGGNSMRRGGGGIYLSGGTGLQGGGSIEMICGNSTTNSGGNVLLQSGVGPSQAGDISILTPDQMGGMDGGHINIQTGNSGNFAGRISIKTGNAGLGTTGIDILTGTGAAGNNILLQTGDKSSGDGNTISLITGKGETKGGNIVLSTSESLTGGNGGDILLTPANGGLVVVSGSGTYSGTWTQASDERFKTDIKPISNATEKVLQMEGVSYYLRKDEFPEKNFDSDLHIGLIAQNVEQVIPEVVKTDSDGYKSIAYQNLVPVLIEAIKEQQASIELLKEEINKLKSESQNQMAKFSSIEK